jgi:hypothetical protein
MLLLPAIEKTFNITEERALKGVSFPTTREPLNFTNWKSGVFQQHYVLCFDDKIGYKPTLVRLFNQIDFSLFDKPGQDYIVAGKSGYLFTKDNLDAYTGKDKLSHSELKKKIGYVYQVQKYLENKGIHFLFVFASSKARIYPEFFPSRYSGKKKGLSNYEEYLKIIKEEYPDLHVLDMNAYFLQLKNKVNFPVYPKGGVHWTKYTGNKYFIDTLLGYLGEMQHKRFPRIRERNFHWSSKLEEPDDDIRQTMNLCVQQTDTKLPYADFYFLKEPAANKPRLLVIADSYYSMIYKFSSYNDLFSKTNFWYYNKTRFPEEYYNKTTDPVFLRDDLLNHDFVVVMATEVNLNDLFLFPESAVSWLGIGNAETMKKIAHKQERIQFFINQMRNTPEWLRKLKQNAKQTNRTLEAVLLDDAEFLEKLEEQNNRMK